MTRPLRSLSVGIFVILISGTDAGVLNWCDGDGEKIMIVKDMHDGDMKQIHKKGSSLTITPYKNNQTWIVEAQTKKEGKRCSATVDFNVPGKPNPPPVPLTATYITNWHVETGGEGYNLRSQWEFTDPTGTLASTNFPLNRWVDVKVELWALPAPCVDVLPPGSPTKKGVFADLHDGDLKEVTIAGTFMTIKPFRNNQTWEVKTELDLDTCSAIVDFNVPGKPNPPSGKLVAKWWESEAGPVSVVPLQKNTHVLEFYQKDWHYHGAAELPLNQWVKLATPPSDSGKNIMI